MNAYDLLPHEHCWHSTGSVLLSYPPQHPQFCCDCGEGRVLRGQGPTYRGHGPWLNPVDGSRLRQAQPLPGEELRAP